MSNVFIDKSTGEEVSILSEDVNFLVLNNNIRIKKDVFYKKFEEKSQIDPNSFFSQQYSASDPLLNLANKLKSLDTSKIVDEGTGTKVKYNPPVTLSDSSQPYKPVQPQTEESITLTPDQKRAMLEEWRRTQPGAQIPEVQKEDWADDERFLNGDKPILQKAPEVKSNPIEMMFKMFKNNYLVKLNISIEENIPSPNFISIIQENVETDAIEYYANLISSKLLKDPEKLKTEIYNQLKSTINKELGIDE
jgi:hypothetical protein